MELRVWPGCLACYNAGRLVGEWVDATEAAEWRCPIDPSHEEFQCLDDEIPWLSHEIGATEATEWAEAVADVEDHEAEAFVIFAKHESWRSPSDVDLDDFRDRYCGEWESLEAYAWNMFDELYPEHKDMPGFMITVDLVAWQQDYHEESGHVFRSC